jgi:tetratricopeptide (TPR) repeat protein
MSQDHHTNKNSPSESKSEREILELRIDQKLADAKEALRDFNKVELQRIASNIHEPKLKRLRNWSGIIITVLVIGNIAGWYSVTERVHSEADRVINQKLIDPQLTSTLDEALSKKAIPFIAAQVQPIETNVAALKANVNEQTALIGAMTLDISNKQTQLTSEQMAIRKQLHPLSDQIISLQSSVDAAQEQAKKLQEEQKLMALLNRGEVFDKDAIQELQTFAQGTNEIAPLAQAMFNKVQRTLILDRGALSYLIRAEGTGTNQYGGPFTSDELAMDLLSSSGSTMDGVVNLLGNQKIFVPKLVELAHQSKDLWTINRIAKALNDITGVNFYPWDLQPLDQWWAQNKMNYTNWPYDQYAKADAAIHATRYEEALTNYEAVLVIDPTADRGRALAVGCAIEVGDMTKAQQLNTNYALKGERWQRWANGKMMLATNGIQQGTEEFVFITKKYPTFPAVAWISPGNHILQQIDWALYSKLMQTTNANNK